MEAELYASDLPYPSITVTQPCLTYARMMLDNAGGSNSEMSAISLYLYNHIVAVCKPEVSKVFYQVNLTEMHHLEIFSELALQLGEDPRLWTQMKNTKEYWSPCHNRYTFDIRCLLFNAIAGEKAAIQKYRCQAQTIKDPCIVAILNRIILDEEVHVKLFKRLYDEYSQ